jgi:hypothetical protein
VVEKGRGREGERERGREGERERGSKSKRERKRQPHLAQDARDRGAISTG